MSNYCLLRVNAERRQFIISIDNGFSGTIIVFGSCLPMSVTICLIPARAGLDAVADPRGRNIRAGTAILNINKRPYTNVQNFTFVLSDCCPFIGMRFICDVQRQFCF